eukprot:CAMPEP_0185306338 /NCGR_PEP_ID=MMETSP1363-20130426/16020_1 /TAXON_ID=38817 /ORGANISM="Gephyrocapsa oceanica, Strain RCC1303" /LENGTH=86 /DNA_ID=CAMNT_0027903621 /DNA_START=305 /DNA_END=565 /DNA_ORIENTATION=-
MSAAVGGSVLLTKMKMAFSGGIEMRLRITYTNWPTVRSIGIRYFRLSTGGMSERGSFSQMTGMRSGYFSRIRAASACRFSNGWSFL